MVTEGVDGVRRSVLLVCVDAAQVDAYNACSEEDNPAGGAGLGLVLQKKAHGVAGESGVLVGHVITGSVADLSGRIGLYDRVLQIDGVPVSDAADVKEVQKQLYREQGQRINLVIAKAAFAPPTEGRDMLEHVELVAAPVLGLQRAAAARKYRHILQKAAAACRARRNIPGVPAPVFFDIPRKAPLNPLPGAHFDASPPAAAPPAKGEERQDGEALRSVDDAALARALPLAPAPPVTASSGSALSFWAAEGTGGHAGKVCQTGAQNASAASSSPPPIPPRSAQDWEALIDQELEPRPAPSPPPRDALTSGERRRHKRSTGWFDSFLMPPPPILATKVSPPTAKTSASHSSRAKMSHKNGMSCGWTGQAFAESAGSKGHRNKIPSAQKTFQVATTSKFAILEPASSGAMSTGDKAAQHVTQQLPAVPESVTESPPAISTWSSTTQIVPPSAAGGGSVAGACSKADTASDPIGPERKPMPPATVGDEMMSVDTALRLRLAISKDVRDQGSAAAMKGELLCPDTLQPLHLPAGTSAHAKGLNESPWSQTGNSETSSRAKAPTETGNTVTGTCKQETGVRETHVVSAVDRRIDMDAASVSATTSVSAPDMLQPSEQGVPAKPAAEEAVRDAALEPLTPGTPSAISQPAARTHPLPQLRSDLDLGPSIAAEEGYGGAGVLAAVDSMTVDRSLAMLRKTPSVSPTKHHDSEGSRNTSRERTPSSPPSILVSPKKKDGTHAASNERGPKGRSPQPADRQVTFSDLQDTQQVTEINGSGGRGRDGLLERSERISGESAAEWKPHTTSQARGAAFSSTSSSSSSSIDVFDPARQVSSEGGVEIASSGLEDTIQIQAEAVRLVFEDRARGIERYYREFPVDEAAALSVQAVHTTDTPGSGAAARPAASKDVGPAAALLDLQTTQRLAFLSAFDCSVVGNLFDAFDVDGDGVLSQAEGKKLLTQWLKGAQLHLLSVLEKLVAGLVTCKIRMGLAMSRLLDTQAGEDDEDVEWVLEKTEMTCGIHLSPHDTSVDLKAQERGKTKASLVIVNFGPRLEPLLNGLSVETMYKSVLLPMHGSENGVEKSQFLESFVDYLEGYFGVHFILRQLLARDAS